MYTAHVCSAIRYYIYPEEEKEKNIIIE